MERQAKPSTFCNKFHLSAESRAFGASDSLARVATGCHQVGERLPAGSVGSSPIKETPTMGPNDPGMSNTKNNRTLPRSSSGYPRGQSGRSERRRHDDTLLDQGGEWVI